MFFTLRAGGRPATCGTTKSVAASRIAAWALSAPVSLARRRTGEGSFVGVPYHRKWAVIREQAHHGRILTMDHPSVSSGDVTLGLSPFGFLKYSGNCTRSAAHGYVINQVHLDVSPGSEHRWPNDRFEPRSCAPVCDRHSPSDGRSRKCFLLGNSHYPKSFPQWRWTNTR